MITSGAVFVRPLHPHRRVTPRHAQASDFADPLGAELRCLVTGILLTVPALRVEYSQFKLAGVRGAADDGDEHVLLSPLASGYANVVCQTGDFEPSKFVGWTIAPPVTLDVDDLRLQCWEGAPEWPVPLAPGRYALVMAVRPSVVPPEVELLSLTQREVVVEHCLHFTPAV